MIWERVARESKVTRDDVGTLHDCCCCFWVAGSLITRLAKGDRIPLTLQLKPLVEPCTGVWNQHSGQDLEDKQVSMTLMCSCPQSSANVVHVQ